MKLRKFLLAGAAALAVSSAPSQASIIDNPNFRVLGLVIVWGADATGAAPIVSDFIVDNGAGGVDLIADDVHTVVTGSLAPTPDSAAGALTVDGVGQVAVDADSDGALDALSAFSIDPTTDITGDTDLTARSSFFVASNTAFAIDAAVTQVTPAADTDFELSDIGYSLSMSTDDTGQTGVTFGGSAQFPHSGNSATSGIDTTVTDLAALNGAQIFLGDRLTAAAPGTITAQSVRFDSVYTLGGSAGYDLSDGAGEIEAQVVYTVFVP